MSPYNHGPDDKHRQKSGFLEEQQSQRQKHTNLVVLVNPTLEMSIELQSMIPIYIMLLSFLLNMCKSGDEEELNNNTTWW